MHWTLTKLEEVPMNHYANGRLSTVLEICPFKRKIFTDGYLLNHKGRMCVHAGMQKWGINYQDAYDSVVNCIIVLTLLEITKIHKLKLRYIYFVLELSQAEFGVNVYMELPIVIDPPNGCKRDYILKLNKYIYGLNQDNANWFKTFKAGLNYRYL